MYAYLMSLYYQILSNRYNLFSLVDELTVIEILYHPLLVLHVILSAQVLHSTTADRTILLFGLEMQQGCYAPLGDTIELGSIFETTGEVDLVGHLLED